MREKVESLKKDNRLVELLSTTKSKYIVGTLLLSGIGIALPRIFHLLAGSSAGSVFLPMHIAVLISALVFGGISGSIVAGSSVIFSYLLTGMPALARLPYMLVELVIYALLLILGRVLYSGVLFACINIFGLPTYGISVIESLKIGLPGVLIQLIFVPIIAKFIKKGIGFDD